MINTGGARVTRKPAKKASGKKKKPAKKPAKNTAGKKKERDKKVGGGKKESPARQNEAHTSRDCPGWLVGAT